MLYFTILLALFSGIGDPFLALTLKKPKENHCFWLRTLENIRKTFVFVFPRASGDPGGTIGPTTPKKYISQTPDPPPKRPLCYGEQEGRKSRKKIKDLGGQ